jgi:allantoin racemase
MAKVLVLVPFAMDRKGVANRRAQLKGVRLGPKIEFDFRPVTAGPQMYMSPHDFAFMDMAIFEAGMDAEKEGYDAVCIDTMSDSGMDALRSVLDIPVISPGKAAMLFALTLGNKFGLMAAWEPAAIRTRKFVKSLGLDAFCAGVEVYDVPPDYVNLMAGKEDKTLPKMLAACKRAIANGADVMILGSTTMHQAHAYLSEKLPIPVVNPGPLTYKLVETVLALKLSHSRTPYPKPIVGHQDVIHAMFHKAGELMNSPTLKLKEELAKKKKKQRR